MRAIEIEKQRNEAGWIVMYNLNKHGVTGKNQLATLFETNKELFPEKHLPQKKAGGGAKVSYAHIFRQMTYMGGGVEKQNGCYKILLLGAVNRTGFMASVGKAKFLDIKGVGTMSGKTSKSDISCGVYTSDIAAVCRPAYNAAAAFICDKFYNVHSYRQDNSGDGTYRFKVYIHRNQVFSLAAKQAILASCETAKTSMPALAYWLYQVRKDQIIPIWDILNGEFSDFTKHFAVDIKASVAANKEEISKMSTKTIEVIKQIVENDYGPLSETMNQPFAKKSSKKHVIQIMDEFIATKCPADPIKVLKNVPLYHLCYGINKIYGLGGQDGVLPAPIGKHIFQESRGIIPNIVHNFSPSEYYGNLRGLPEIVEKGEFNILLAYKWLMKTDHYEKVYAMYSILMNSKKKGGEMIYEQFWNMKNRETDPNQTLKLISEQQHDCMIRESTARPSQFVQRENEFTNKWKSVGLSYAVQAGAQINRNIDFGYQNNFLRNPVPSIVATPNIGDSAAYTAFLGVQEPKFLEETLTLAKSKELPPCRPNAQQESGLTTSAEGRQRLALMLPIAARNIDSIKAVILKLTSAKQGGKERSDSPHKRDRILNEMKLGTRRKPNYQNMGLFPGQDVIHDENGKPLEVDGKNWPKSWTDAAATADKDANSWGTDNGKRLLDILLAFTRTYQDLYPHTSEFEANNETKEKMKIAIEATKKHLADETQLKLSDEYFEDALEILSVSLNRITEIPNLETPATAAEKEAEKEKRKKQRGKGPSVPKNASRKLRSKAKHVVFAADETII